MVPRSGPLVLSSHYSVFRSSGPPNVKTSPKVYVNSPCRSPLHQLSSVNVGMIMPKQNQESALGHTWPPQGRRRRRQQTLNNAPEQPHHTHSFYIVFIRVCESGLIFCCYLHDLATTASVFAAIYYGWRSCISFLLLFTSLGEHGSHFCCYLLRFESTDLTKQ